MSLKLESYSGYNQGVVASHFFELGWKVKIISVNDVHLIAVHKGAAIECSDGRFDSELLKRKMRGPRIFGSINAIMSLITGGGEDGLEAASRLVSKFGLTPGTHSADHGGCGYFDLWKNGRLKSANYPYKPDHEELAKQRGCKLGHLLAERVRALGGYHFRLNGEHCEEAVRYNHFRNTTDISGNCRRFIVDDWVLADLGIPVEKRLLLIAECVEQLRPEAKRLEIITF